MAHDWVLSAEMPTHVQGRCSARLVGFLQAQTTARYCRGSLRHNGVCLVVVGKKARDKGEGEGGRGREENQGHEERRDG